MQFEADLASRKFPQDGSERSSATWLASTWRDTSLLGHLLPWMRKKVSFPTVCNTPRPNTYGPWSAWIRSGPGKFAEPVKSINFFIAQEVSIRSSWGKQRFWGSPTAAWGIVQVSRWNLAIVSEENNVLEIAEVWPWCPPQEVWNVDRSGPAAGSLPSQIQNPQSSFDFWMTGNTHWQQY